MEASGAGTLENHLRVGLGYLRDQSGRINPQALEILEQTAKLSDQRLRLLGGRSLLLVVDSLVQHQPDHLGDAVSHRPGRSFGVDSRLEAGKQTGEERFLGVNSGPGNLAQ